MTTLAHPTLNGSAGTCLAARAVLERAIAAAPSNIPPPRGLRRLFARDRSAAGLIKRYGLWPAIEHSYERVTREFGPVGVEVSAEDCFGSEYVMVIFLCDIWNLERLFAFDEEIGRECYLLLGERRGHRLITLVEPHPDLEPPDE